MDGLGKAGDWNAMSLQKGRKLSRSNPATDAVGSTPGVWRIQLRRVKVVPASSRPRTAQEEGTETQAAQDGQEPQRSTPGGGPTAGMSQDLSGVGKHNSQKGTGAKEAYRVQSLRERIGFGNEINAHLL